MVVRFPYRPAERKARPEGGWILIVFLVAFAVMVILLEASIAQSAAGDIRHDKEEELFHRGHQYERAIQLYFRRFGRYPTDIGQLENTNNLRFLRRAYQDPITGGAFKLIRFGQQHPKRNRNFAAPGVPAAQIAQPVGSSIGTPASSLASKDSPISDDIGPIVGVKSKSDKESMKEIDEKNHYNELEFWYDPTQDNRLGGVQQPAPAPNPNGITQPTPTPQNPPPPPIPR